MDLREYQESSAVRHPWEIARLSSIKQIIGLIPDSELRILDVGCGDGFVSRELAENGRIGCITAIDTNLNEPQLEELCRFPAKVRFTNKYDETNIKYYNLILFLDVIEHIQDEKYFLMDIVDKYLEDNGHVLITVPAYQSLFGPHDTFLAHYRRYDIEDLKTLIKSVDLEILFSGYLFFSLLPLRVISNVFEKIFSERSEPNKGVGGWRYGKMVTKAICSMFFIENTIMLRLSRSGIILPGLTAWALCKKPR